MEEHGWYHPEIGYWQTSGELSAEIIEAYPEGTVSFPIKPGADFEVDTVNLTWSPIAIDLVALKGRLKASIDDAAERERLKYITAGAGQAMTYQQKADEARNYLAASDPDPVDYHMLAAEVGITGPTIADVAQVVLAAYSQWQVIGAAIEAARLGTKAAIDAAIAPEMAQAAADAVQWPSAGGDE